MNSMTKKGYLFWDDEIANSGQKICQVSYVLTDINLNPLGKPFSSYIDPKDDFDPNYTRIHHIKEQDVQGSQNFQQFCNENDFINLLSDYIFVAHNAKGADLHHIEKSLSAYEIQMPPVQYVDTEDLARSMWGNGEASLEKACMNAGVKLTNHHDACDDAQACFELFKWFIANNVDAKLQDWPDNSSRSSSPSEKFRSQKLRQKDGLGYVNGDSSRSVESVLLEFESLGMRGNPAEIETLKDKHFVVSGKVPGYPKNNIEDTLKSLGAKTSKKISSTTEYLVIGDNVGSSKINDAKMRQGEIKVITVQELLELLSNLYGC